ncbi:nucleoside-diphosphate kinase [Formicincola oecophyllae]|uniref:Nucleoside diphosphate kinase n=1 Tax=Formicincola oecophyllae TaxID=2558361 RepID=A0A4Y6UAG9_9PROT|nr:nucleoside-diphosphate kinase [Formicincola oecophyllae]QDH13940.1 nucleoside-diphosphate kinase [Formicincola oecophyllae]
MPLERTFSIIKPDATRRNLTGEINAVIENNGFAIVGQRRIHMSRAQAEGFYRDHKDQDFFQALVDYMVSEPVVVQVLEGEDAIKRYRALMGPTDATKAGPDTLRGRFALSMRENSVHGSDSPANAQREIGYFFSEVEILPCTPEKP